MLDLSGNTDPFKGKSFLASDVTLEEFDDMALEEWEAIQADFKEDFDPDYDPTSDPDYVSAEDDEFYQTLLGRFDKQRAEEKLYRDDPFLPRPLNVALKHSTSLPYLIANFLPRKKVMVCTAPKGSHKTDLAIALAFAVAGGAHIADNLPMRRTGKVLFMAGENPEDVMDRIKALCWKQEYNSELRENIDILDRSFDLTADVAKLVKACKGKRYDLVLVDTAQAYGPREESNSNTVMLNYAKALRVLTHLGGASVFVLAHPTKSEAKANAKEFEPYGGGAFANEVDGLCSIHSEGDTVRLSKNAKWRGKNWDDLLFEPKVIDDCPALMTREKDDEGVWHTDQGTAPMLVPISGEKTADVEKQPSTDYERLVYDALRVFSAGRVQVDKKRLEEVVYNYIRSIQENGIDPLPPYEKSKSPDRASTRTALNRALDGLMKKGLVQEIGGFFARTDLSMADVPTSRERNREQH